MTREERALKNLKQMCSDGRYLGSGSHVPLEVLEDFEDAIKALETLEEFEKAQIITGGRLNGRTYAYKCGLEDGKRKALEQEPILEKIWNIVFPLSIMSTDKMEHEAIMQIAEMLEPLCLPESEDKE